MPLTLKDIAKIAGVAESTVSRAINNKPGVGAQTREKIMEIVREHNYQPNQLAQGLAKRETHLLALIVADLTGPGYSEIIKSMEKTANQAGYQLIICNTDNNLAKEKTYLNLVGQHRVDGAIILGGTLANNNIMKLALNQDELLVLVNCLAEEVLIPTVLVDNARGGYLATVHLLEQGLEKIALVMGPANDFLESEKLNGYQQALADYNIPFREQLIIKTNLSREGGYNAFFRVMKIDELPDGFFVTNDLLAIGLTEAIKMGGYLIPGDFAVVGYGDSIISAVINPALTVVAEPLQQLGRLAAEYIIKLINDQAIEEVIRVLEPELIIRESSSP
ncbi:MAG: LacI family transcriptional regulator [Halanaerobiales bacterium]|nr:LacI family transcriptional regulator [Halanaerobiales bacterium]